MERSEAIARLKQHQAELKRLGVVHLYLFGSTARGEAGEDSDVDLFFDHPEGSLGLFALMDVQTLESDRRNCWLVERGIEIISEASRHLSDELKARHPEIPWSKVAGIGNVLRHEYERIAHDVLWRVVCDDLPPFENVCREELKREGAAEQ